MKWKHSRRKSVVVCDTLMGNKEVLQYATNDEGMYQITTRGFALGWLQGIPLTYVISMDNTKRWLQ